MSRSAVSSSSPGQRKRGPWLRLRLARQGVRFVLGQWLMYIGTGACVGHGVRCVAQQGRKSQKAHGCMAFWITRAPGVTRSLRRGVIALANEGSGGTRHAA